MDTWIVSPTATKNLFEHTQRFFVNRAEFVRVRIEWLSFCAKSRAIHLEWRREDELAFAPIPASSLFDAIYNVFEYEEPILTFRINRYLSNRVLLDTVFVDSVFNRLDPVSRYVILHRILMNLVITPLNLVITPLNLVITPPNLVIIPLSLARTLLRFPRPRPPPLTTLRFSSSPPRTRSPRAFRWTPTRARCRGTPPWSRARSPSASASPSSTRTAARSSRRSSPSPSSGVSFEGCGHVQ